MDDKLVYLLTTFEGFAGLANFLASRAAILVGCAPLLATSHRTGCWLGFNLGRRRRLRQPGHRPEPGWTGLEQQNSYSQFCRSTLQPAASDTVLDSGRSDRDRHDGDDWFVLRMS